MPDIEPLEDAGLASNESEEGTTNRIERIVSDSKMLSEDVTEWLGLKLQLVQIELYQHLREELNAILSSVIVVGFLTIGLFLGAIGLSIYVGQLMGDLAQGFLTVAFCVIVGGLFLARIQPQWIAGALGHLIPHRWTRRGKD